MAKNTETRRRAVKRTSLHTARSNKADTGLTPGRRHGRAVSERVDKPYQNGYYQYSSAAYELAPIPDEFEEEPQPYKKKKKKTKKQIRQDRIRHIRRRNAPKYVFEARAERKLSMPTILASVLVFLCALFYVFTFGLSAVAQHQTDALRYQLQEQRENNESLRNGIYDSAKLEQIKEIAMTKLGLVVPEEYQKIYIDVPKQSYFVQNSEENDPSVEKNGLEGFFDLFARQ